MGQMKGLLFVDEPTQKLDRHQRQSYVAHTHVVRSLTWQPQETALEPSSSHLKSMWSSPPQLSAQTCLWSLQNWDMDTCMYTITEEGGGRWTDPGSPAADMCGFLPGASPL